MLVKLSYTDGQRNAIIYIYICQVRYVIYKHELHEITMTRIMSKASMLFESIDFCFIRHVGLYTAVTYYFFLSNLSNIFACKVFCPSV